ncbi:MAG TPA: protein kinase [Polyangiaceae bacterium]|nr:protein kinase [Polyangiaceae bacterium]
MTMVIGPQAMGRDEYLPGQSLPGTVYRIVRLISEGDVERVYEVEDPTVGKRYALKTLGDAQADARQLAEKLRESRIFVKVADPHVVDVCAAGVSSDGQCFYVMEMLDGEPLGAILRRDGRLQLGAVLSVGIELSEALASVHAVGVVHRHVKPDNIFIALDSHTSPSTKLLDLAVASALAGAGTSWKTVHGTFGYASPEQLRGEPASPLMDIWSLGCVLYEAFSGQLPFEVSSDWRTFVDGVLGPAPAPRLSDVSPDAPADLVSLIARMLQKEPSRRLPRADMATATLRRIERRLSSRPPPAPVDLSPVDESSHPSAAVPVAGQAEIETTHAAPLQAEASVPANVGAADLDAAMAGDAQAPVPAQVQTRFGAGAAEARAPMAPEARAEVAAEARAEVAAEARAEVLEAGANPASVIDADAGAAPAEAAQVAPVELPGMPAAARVESVAFGGEAVAPTEAPAGTTAAGTDSRSSADVSPAQADAAAPTSPAAVPQAQMLPPAGSGADAVDEDWEFPAEAAAPAPSPSRSESPRALPSVVIADQVAGEPEDTLVGTMADFMSDAFSGSPPEQLLPSVVIAADVAAEAEDTLVGTMADFLDEAVPEAAPEPAPAVPPSAVVTQKVPPSAVVTQKVPPSATRNQKVPPSAAVTQKVPKAVVGSPSSQKKPVPEAAPPRPERRWPDGALALPPSAAGPISEPQMTDAVPDRPPRVTYALLFLSVLVAWMVVALVFLRARRSRRHPHAP